MPSDLDQSPAQPFDLVAKGPTFGFQKNYNTGTVVVPGGANGAVQYNNAGAFGGLTVQQLTALIQLYTSSLPGAVPASGGGVTNYLRADGSWAVPPGGSGIADGNKGDVTVSGSATVWTINPGVVSYSKIQNVSVGNRILGRLTSTGIIQELTGTQAATLIDVFTSTLKGSVPASGGGTANFLRADGTWAPAAGSPGGSAGQVQFNNSGSFGGYTGTQVTALLDSFTTSLKGVAPPSGGGTANFLRADGTWAAPPGGGGLHPTPLTLYVRSGGSDSNDGLSPATAFLTVQKAADILQTYQLNNAVATVDVGAGTFAGASFTGGGYINVTVQGAGQTSTIFNAPPPSGEFAGGPLVFIATQGAVLTLAHSGINVPANCSGIFLQSFGLATTVDCRMTGTNSTSIGLHAEGYSFFEMADPAPCDFYGTFGNLITIGATGGYLHDSGVITVHATVTGAALFADAGSCFRILVSGAFVLSGGSAGQSYVVQGNSIITSETDLEAAFGNHGVLGSGGRSSGPLHHVVEIGSSTLTASVVGSANGGTITVTGNGATSQSQILIDMHEIVQDVNGNPAPYAVSPQTGGGTWNARAVIQVFANTGNGLLNVLFDNNGVNLTNAQTYKINYVCGG